MKDTERIIGSLEEFKKWSEREFNLLRKEITDIKDEMKTLNHFKWKVAGGASALTLALSAAFEVAKNFRK